MSDAILNLSCYKFTPLDDLEAHRQVVAAACRDQEVKGTVLLAPEGINFFLAGTRPQLDAVLAVLRRLSAGKSPFSADRKHLHHRLLDMGHSHLHAVLIFYGWTAVVSVGFLLFFTALF